MNTQVKPVDPEIVVPLLEEMRSQLSRRAVSTDDDIRGLIEETVLEAGSCRTMSSAERVAIVKLLFNRLRRYDVLQPLLDDDSITEIMINGPRQIFIERGGKLTLSGVQFESEERLETVVQQIVSDVDRKVNRSEPIADARLKDGSRVNVVLPPVALDGPAVTIRKFSKTRLTMERLIELGAINEEIADFLMRAVRCRFNILICGGTGSGKTTFLNALSEYIGKGERVVTIEDSAELQLNEIDNLIRMETRSSSRNQEMEVSMRDLIKTSLRMRPDRIVVGEVRGEEALDMLQAMNTGHEGSLTTGHSNSGPDMLHRLETMILSGATDLPLHSVRTQISSGLDLIVFLRRSADGARRLVSIDEIIGLEDGQVKVSPLYAYTRQDGFVRKGDVQKSWKFQAFE